MIRYMLVINNLIETKCRTKMNDFEEKCEMLFRSITLWTENARWWCMPPFPHLLSFKSDSSKARIPQHKKSSKARRRRTKVTEWKFLLAVEIILHDSPSIFFVSQGTTFAFWLNLLLRMEFSLPQVPRFACVCVPLWHSTKPFQRIDHHQYSVFFCIVPP